MGRVASTLCTGGRCSRFFALGPALTVSTLSAIGCHSTSSLPAPPLAEETRSVLIVGGGEEEETTISAHEMVDGRFEPEPIQHRRGPTSFELLEYRCTLERLGLQPGLQALAEPAAAARIPPPARVLSDLDWSEGQLSERSGEVLRRLPVGEDNLCLSTRARIKATPLSPPPDGRNDPAFTIALDGERVLVGSRNGYYYLVEGLSVTPVSSIPEGDFLGAFQRDDGELFLMNDDGVLIRGRLETGFQVVTSTAPIDGTDRLWLEGSRGDGPFELYAQTDSRAFLKLEGDTWRLLATSPQYDVPFRPRVVWHGPNRASTMSMGRGRNTIIHYVDGVIEEEVVPANSGLSSIAIIPPFGLVIGRDDGSVWYKVQGVWTPLMVGRELHYVRSITPLGDGFIFGAGFEINFLEFHFFQYFPSTGACPPERLTQYATTHLAPLSGGRYVVAGLGSFDAPLELTLLEVEAPPGDCSRSE